MEANVWICTGGVIMLAQLGLAVYFFLAGRDDAGEHPIYRRPPGEQDSSQRPG